jgi:flagellar hook-associated protein 2
VLQFGSGSGGLVVRSSDNVFENVVKGVNVTINSASEDPVSVNVTKDSAKLTTAVREVVDAYNSIRTNLDLVTEFNEEDSSTGILFGTTAALRVDTDLARAISDRYLGLGSFDSLASVGISVNEEGRLSLDAARLEEAFTEDPTALQRFFTDASSGVVAKLNTVIDSLAGEESSLLASRSKTLTDIVESNVERIAFLDERLEREREQLLQQFARLEQSIAGLQQNLSALSSIQALPAFTESGRGALRIGDTN